MSYQPTIAVSEILILQKYSILSGNWAILININLETNLSVVMSNNSVLNEHSPKLLQPVVNALPL